MKRGLNNTEKRALAILKEKGYKPVVKELNGCLGPEYYAEIIELKCLVGLSHPGNLSEIPNRSEINQLKLKL